MCTGIILTNGDHLQSLREVEDHFGVNLDSYKEPYYSDLDRSCCCCQIDLHRFMSEPPRDKLFTLDCGEFWENDRPENQESEGEIKT
jgi:hypothetical protein